MLTTKEPNTMSTATKTLIAATVKITKMDSDQMQTALLEILASNPSIIYKVLNVAASSTTYKVVLDSITENKLGLIKLFREMAGAGLGEAKAWSEGGSFHGLPSGVFKMGMTLAEAEAFASKINVTTAFSSSTSPMRVKVMRDNDEYDYRSRVRFPM